MVYRKFIIYKLYNNLIKIKLNLIKLIVFTTLIQFSIF